MVFSLDQVTNQFEITILTNNRSHHCGYDAWDISKQLQKSGHLTFMQFSFSPSTDANPRANILLVFKTENRWNELLLKTLTSKFHVWHTYCKEPLKERGLEDVLISIVSEISEHKIQSVIVDQEFFSLFHGGAVRVLAQRAKVGLIFFDDCHNHYMNRQNACFADFVITGPDPIERIQYESYGIPALSFTLENDLIVPENRQLPAGSPRPVDLFFAGYNHKPGRREFLEAAKSSGLSFLSHETELHGSVSYDELYRMMGAAKIVLNFSKTDNAGPMAYALGYREPVVYQLKGRIVEAGLCGACCISESFPTIGIAGLSEAVPTFESPTQMIALTRQLLATGEWKRLARKLREVVKRDFGAKNFLAKLEKLAKEPRKAGERRVVLGADSNYAINVSNRIKTYDYTSESVRQKDWNFFIKFIENAKYDSISYRPGDDCYPFNV